MIMFRRKFRWLVEIPGIKPKMCRCNQRGDWHQLVFEFAQDHEITLIFDDCTEEEMGDLWTLLAKAWNASQKTFDSFLLAEKMTITLISATGPEGKSVLTEVRVFSVNYLDFSPHDFPTTEVKLKYKTSTYEATHCPPIQTTLLPSSNSNE